MSNANIYISGPISGDRHFLAKFNLAERLLVEKYCTPFCQCFNPAKEQALDKENMTRNEIWGAYLERDLSVMRNLVLQGGITYLVLLPGWKTSKGSCLERAVAESYNMPCMEIRDIFPDWDDLVIAELQRLGIQFEESKNLNKAKFTPGPLETDFFNVEDSGVYMVKDSLNQAVCGCFTQYPFAGKPGITDDEAEGNAFLYAAAPDMFSMLQSILDDCEICTACSNYPGDITPRQQIEDVLKKARGE